MAEAKKLQEDEFIEKYIPVKNHLVDDCGFDGCMFETFGQEVDYVVAKANDKETRNHVWTIVSADGDEMYYTAGYYLVNRIGYIITEKPWETGYENFKIDTNMGEEVYFLYQDDFSEDGWAALIESTGADENECEELDVLHDDIIIVNTNDLNIFLLEYANVTEPFIKAVQTVVEDAIIFQFKGDGDGLGFILDIWDSQDDFEEGEANQSFTFWFDDYRV